MLIDCFWCFCLFFQQSRPDRQGRDRARSLLYVRSAVLRVLGDRVGWHQGSLRQPTGAGQLCNAYRAGDRSRAVGLRRADDLAVYRSDWRVLLLDPRSAGAGELDENY